MGLNDPQWGGGGKSGPPDLDELWRNFNRKLESLFVRRNGGGGAPPSGPKMSAGSLWVFVAIAVLVWLASGFYIVDASQRGVVLRFGKYVETTQPGPRWHLPYPIESPEIVDVSTVRTVEIGYRNNVKSKIPQESLMLTDDENIIDIQFAVQYIIKDPEEYLFQNRAPEDAVRQVAETAIRQVVGKSRMNFVLYEGREQVADQAAALMQKILDRYKTGITVSKVTMQNAQPPEQVQAAFDDAVKANQDRERLKNEGQAYANDVVPRASGDAARLTQEAQGYKQRVMANAEGDASRFQQILTEYDKAPRVTRDRMYIDTMQQVLSNTNKILVDQKKGGNLLYLPLDKLIQAVEPAAAQSQDDAAAKAPASGGEDRSRDAFRNRDREDRP
ncbi:MAG: FtsH protease activity modulator HflK [Burkholderiales bacterium]|nr:FtsH protease activity modulator HflK [Burkholderiales bacterium]